MRSCDSIISEGAAKPQPYAITPLEEAQFRRDGYLLLRSAVPMADAAFFLGEVDRLVREANNIGAVLREPYYHEGSYKLTRILRLSTAFDQLVDHPGYFGKLVCLIGSHIQLMGSEIFVRGAAQGTITGFHTDLGAGLQKILPTDQNAFLQIKAQIFLTDLSVPDCSNFALIPGSHRMRVADSNELCMINDVNRQIGPDGSLPAQAMQVLARPGDVLLFPHSLWHAVAPNRSGRTRYSITLRYGQMALRPFERFDPILADHGRKLTPRQRRLLGDLGEEGASPYRPRFQDEIMCRDEQHSSGCY
ncbi:phytanoyl-CoA dioxygenase family protein [Rhodopseudomonas palustris]